MTGMNSFNWNEIGKVDQNHHNYNWKEIIKIGMKKPYRRRQKDHLDRNKIITIGTKTCIKETKIMRIEMKPLQLE